MNRPQWEVASDDSMNKVLKTAIVSLYGYGSYCVVVELWERFV
tara:strand:+ start:1049 stop:1177 length:129 start_codon:yes stop_codon:yes gene_type:complete